MKYLVTEKDRGVRLDVFISENTELSRSAAAKLIESGDATVNGRQAVKKYEMQLGDSVEIVMPEPEPSEALPENIPLDILYEDGDILIINKPSGMVVHPAPGNYTGTLVNALLYHCGDSLSGIGGVIRPGIVHRIDKDTSGLLVVAKNDAAHRILSEELERHGIEREYHALVRGGFKVDTGTVDAPIGRHPVDRKKMAVLTSPDAHAKEAITHYEVISRFGDVSYVKCILETGRTHQIRVHMSYIGHALLGDVVYATAKTRFEKLHAPLFDGQALHAKRLTLTHPTTKERMSFECDLPENFRKMLSLLNRESE
ncbi:MAG: RluA family pseudouridine synthase [Ruminococcaceae bacterium]|nr:RluA family pseudouridine synthase [Oscillospiraceae bacterium]